MTWTLVISGRSEDIEAERVIQEAGRKIVRVLQAHEQEPPNKTVLTVASFNGSHGGAANLFNLSDSEREEIERLQPTETVTPATVAAPVPEVDVSSLGGETSIADLKSYNNIEGTAPATVESAEVL